MKSRRAHPRDEAFLLHRRPYRESSLIAEVLTYRHGRLALVGRAARRPGSANHVITYPFSHLELTWQGRGELVTLRSAERLAPPLVLGGDVLISGLYVNELLLRLLHRHDPCPDVFTLYAGLLRALAGLADGDGRGLQRTLRIFERRLLAGIGYGLVLDHEVATGGTLEAEQEYDYYPHHGPVEAGRPVPGHHGPIRVHGSTLTSLDTGVLEDDRSLREARRLMRGNLLVCLGGQPLQSWRLMGRKRYRS